MIEHRDTAGSSNRENNNFGFLRLLFATLVILAHSPEMIDGNRSREILTRIFGTLSFGEFAVDGFFLISGYLITYSFLQSRSSYEYLTKRVLRIYPGYAVAYVFSLLVGVLAGGRMAGSNAFHVVKYIVRQPLHVILLHIPSLHGAFKGLPYPSLNLPMWTVSYEFRCYLVVMLLGAFGLLRNRRIYLGVTIAFLGLLVSQKVFPSPHGWIESIAGATQEDIRFLAVFCCGGAFCLFRDWISYTKTAAVVAIAILLPLMFVHRFAETALATFGGYLLFWFAFHAKSKLLSGIGKRIDLSYGLYLYAWPVQSLLIWRWRHISPWLLFGLTVVTAGSLAYVSWTLVERPFLRMKSRLMTLPAKNVFLITYFLKQPRKTVQVVRETFVNKL